MKEIYKKLFDLFSLLKVISLCLASLYLIFWLYRFFYLPYTDFLSSIFDIALIPIKNVIETQQVISGRVSETGYFIVAAFLAVASFVFARLEDFVVELDRRYDLKEIVRRQVSEKQLNKELEKEHIDNLLKYEYFSVFLKYRTGYVNEIIAETNKVSTDEALLRSYRNTISLINQRLPMLRIKKVANSCFIRGRFEDSFDEIIETLLEAIRVTKVQNANDAMSTDFMLIIDAQTSEEEQTNSYKTLSLLSDMEHYNAAIITLPFKIRFELNQKESNYVVDSLGFSVLNDAKLGDESEIYLLKSKPKQI